MALAIGTDDVRFLKPAKDSWAEAQVILQKRMTRPTYESWIKPLQIIEINNENAVLAVANDFARGIVQPHAAAIREALSAVLGYAVAVKLVTNETVKPEGYSPTIASITVMPPGAPYVEEDDGTSSRPTNSSPRRPLDPRPVSAHNLNPKYTFETFVVGSNNRFSHSAAQAVAKSPGQAYSPLFIHGGVGLGKTHMMHAIGNEILRHSKQLTVRYLSCEKFTNELVNAIKEDSMANFRKRYRQVDVLLVDDVQFLQGKEATQEEFFHTFNSLREAGRQIVLSSDRPPSAISKLEERLRSRFEWGLITDIQAPDLETRVAILQKKCQLEQMRVADEVLEYIASLFTTNIRELEGALIRANAYSSLIGSPLTIGSITEILRPSGKAMPTKPTVTIEQLTDTVAVHYRVESAELRSAKRSQDLALPRHIAMYLAYELMELSYNRIGECFGNRKHTSIMHACTRIKAEMLENPRLAESIRQIKKQLGF